MLNFDVVKKLHKVSKLGGRGGGNLDKIQKKSSIFLGDLENVPISAEER